MGAEKTDIITFGKQLLETGDLDPVYIVLWEAGITQEELMRLLVPYWCFYHLGTAAWICSQPNYWTAMKMAAGSKDYPRSSERRHYRGAQALRSVEWLEEVGVVDLWQRLLKCSNEEYATAEAVITEVKSWVGFGNWIAFKVADMLERLNLFEVVFDLDTVMYESPRKAAAMLWDECGQPHSGFNNECAWAVEWLMENLKEPVTRKVGDTHRTFLQEKVARLAPPRYERAINLQEIETILCKWKSHMDGHYHVGEDIAATRRALLRFARVPLCQRLLQAGKRGGLWK